MSAQPITNMSLYSNYGLGCSQAKDVVTKGPDAKVIEYIQQVFSWEPEEYTEEENTSLKVTIEEDELEAYAKLKDKVSSTVDSDIHTSKPKDDDSLNEMKDILCADPKTVATQNDRPCRNQGKYSLQFNYPRLREFLLDDDKFENVMFLLSEASEAEREKMEGVFFRFAVSFDEKEIHKATEELVIAFFIEDEVRTIQKRLKKSIRRIKGRDKKFMAFQCLMPQTRKSPFLESFLT